MPYVKFTKWKISFIMARVMKKGVKEFGPEIFLIKV